MASSKKIKVLIVDDSGLIRAILTEIINSDARFTVVGAAKDPYEAREMIKSLLPDVLTLDIEMPRMNGITFLNNLMRLRPMPVVMISTLTQEGAPATLEALELGAVDFLPKPQGGSETAIEAYREVILDKLYWAARANLGSLPRPEKAPTPDLGALSHNRHLKMGYICAIGASTGGTEAIKTVLQDMPAHSPPIVITQHIPETFSASFAKRLDSVSQMKVCEAEHNQLILPGCAYLAPGHSHLRVAKTAKGYVCRLDKADPVNRHRPSVEVLFDSVLETAGADALAVLLTGMGADGAQALLRLHEKGAMTVAQDEASSVVWGMPGAAVKLGAAEKIMPLSKVARFIVHHAFSV